MNEKDVVRRLIDDRAAGFVALVRWSAPDLYRGLVRIVRSPQIAEELSQDTYLRAWRALSHYSDGRLAEMRLRGWLWTIAMNRARSHFSRSVPALERVEATRDVGDLVADADTCERLLSRLEPSTRTIVVMRHVVGLSYQEISEASGRPVGTVKSDVHRAMKHLRAIGDSHDQ